ncbi:MAG: VWA domain-containing protein [Gammaproteobacteria bacterium]|nr:VWA domain-containing protein [Gammaproteobacteria bacterium]
MKGLAFSHAYVLWLLPLAILPLLGKTSDEFRFTSVNLIPDDPLSRYLDYFLRASGVLLIALVIVALAGIHKPQYTVSTIGQGAQIVLLLDRSRSMDQTFATNKKIISVSQLVNEDSKITVARRILGEFVDKRKSDMLGTMIFSTLPIPVVTLTNKHDIVKASIESSAIGRGLAQTNIGAGMESAIRYFDDKPYTGSRIVILVSDGAAQLDGSMRKTIRDLLRANQVTVYWLYMRSATGPRIIGDNPDPSPELALHRFFDSTDTPYHAYMAENPDDMQRAADDINSLQNLPMRYEEIRPRKSYAAVCYSVAALLALVIVLATLLELRQWPAARQNS